MSTVNKITFVGTHTYDYEIKNTQHNPYHSEYCCACRTNLANVGTTIRPNREPDFSHSNTCLFFAERIEKGLSSNQFFGQSVRNYYFTFTLAFKGKLC